MLRIALVAGEASGDLLGADLIRALRQQHPDITCYGIAGPRMQAEGCTSLYPMERLSVMGLSEVIGRLPELLGMRRRLTRQLIADPPDIFIGIDAPDFNLSLEERLRGAGIPSVHYVSPSVWAWREKRMHKIKRAVDLILTLFPFEEAFYQRHGVPVRCVGHPLADHIPLHADRSAAREQLGIAQDEQVIALLPGSRVSEVSRLAGPMLETAAWCSERRAGLRFLAPMANVDVRDCFKRIQDAFPAPLNLQILDGRADLAMTAADAVLVASGTAALEAMLLKRPMVVTYRLAWLTNLIWRRLGLIKLKHYSLPNLLAGRPLVRELIQEDATAAKMGAALLALLDRDPAEREAEQGVFAAIHQDLKRNAGQQAASAILDLVTHA